MYKTLCMIAVAVASAAVAIPQTNTIVEFDAPNSIFTAAKSINSAGMIAGYYEDAQFTLHGFVRNTTGNITTFDVPGAATGGGQGTVAAGINDSGQIAGWYNPSTAPETYKGFRRDASGKITIVNIPGSTATSIYAINNTGQIAGCAAPTSFCTAYGSTDKGFVTDSTGAILTFSPVNSANVSPMSINANGAAAGFYSDSAGGLHGFIRAASNKITEFDAPGSFIAVGAGTLPWGVNDVGTVAGYYRDLNGHIRGFLRDANGAITEFDAPGTSPNTYPVAINFAGMTTGSYVVSGQSASWYGFVRDPRGRFTSFEAPDASTLYGTFGMSINRAGQVAGYYYDKNAVAHGFLRQ
jgi:predicted membrane protein